jgi:TPR repeat protein
LYEEGKGVERDYGKAFDRYMQAAARGHSAAQYSLGVLYEDGLGRERDLKRARHWYEKAAAGGDPDARAALEAYGGKKADTPGTPNKKTKSKKQKTSGKSG